MFWYSHYVVGDLMTSTAQYQAVIRQHSSESLPLQLSPFALESHPGVDQYYLCFRYLRLLRRSLSAWHSFRSLAVTRPVTET